MANAAVQLPNPALETPVIYKVKPGDSVSRIVEAYYGVSYGSPRYQNAVRFLQLYNPQVQQIDKIRVAQMLRLMPLESRSGLSYCPAPDEYVEKKALAQQGSQEQLLQIPYELRPGHQMLDRYRANWPLNASEESAFWALAMLQENYNWLAIPGGTAFATLGNLTSQGNNQLLHQVRTMYEQYKRGAMTKGQYDAGRRRVLKQYAQMVGPLEKFLMGGRTTQEAIRISRVQGLPATHRIESQLHRLSKLSQLATRGGVLLTAGGLYMECRNIAQTRDTHQKNEIFVETIFSTLAGGAASYGVVIFLASNPAGWVLAAALATGVALTSLAAGIIGRELYNQHGHGIDLVSASGISQVCK